MPTPYVILKSAMSVDGYIDDANAETLVLSSEADWEEVWSVRASCDAVLVGAGTIRSDNCVIDLPARWQSCRKSRGVSRLPLRVTMTRSGNLEPDNCFFDNSARDDPAIILCPSNHSDKMSNLFAGVATVIGFPVELDPVRSVLESLYALGVSRLLIEGGSNIATLFLESGGVDEIQISIAPFFVGQREAVPFVLPGRFPHDSSNRMKIKDARVVGDMAVLTYYPNRL